MLICFTHYAIDISDNSTFRKLFPAVMSHPSLHYLQYKLSLCKIPTWSEQNLPTSMLVWSTCWNIHSSTLQLFPQHFCQLQLRTRLHKITCPNPHRISNGKTKVTFVLLLLIVYCLLKICSHLSGLCWPMSLRNMLR